VNAVPIARDLLDSPDRVDLLWRQVLAAAVDDTFVVLIVDQFEELFTLCADEGERRAFVRCLVAATHDRVRVVLGIRADFLAHCALYPELVAAMRDRQVLVGPVDDAALRRVVREPGVRAGLKVEAALVEAVVADVHGEPGALPLVSHALFEAPRGARSSTSTRINSASRRRRNQGQSRNEWPLTR
jgi:hypothetical protein